MTLLQRALLLAGILTLNNVVSCQIIKSDLQASVARLTDNFFANLQEDPYLKNKILSKSSKTFIDKQVTNYMALVKQTHGLLEHSVTRRSLPIEGVASLTKDDSGVYILDGFIPMLSMKVHFPRDLALFRNFEDGNETWFAGALERKNKNTADDLVIYKLEDAGIYEITRTPVTNGIKIGLHSMSESTYIVVAENNTFGERFHEKTGIFEFGSNNLTKIQSLESEYANDVALWNEQHETFMAVAQCMATNNGTVTYEIDTPIYKWLGKHFDVINHIKTYGAQRITPFIIGNSHFLAVANFRNNLGHTNIYSEIFKYNLHMDQFESYQKISTKAAVDVKHFSFEEGHVKENFLIFANSFDIEGDGTHNYETESILYKYVEDYFIPFQSFKLNWALEWLPVNGPNGEFALLVACKFEGIKAFQYDGWKFVESQSQYTHEAFSKGVVSMRSYQYYGKPIVVVANENDQGTMTNIFEVTFTQQKMLSRFQDDMLQWCQNSLQNLQAKDFNTISKNVMEAPKYDDAVLQLAENVAFDNVTIENLHVVEPGTVNSEDEDELYKLKGELNEYLEEVDQVQQQVQLALHTGGINIFHGNVYVEKLILHNDSKFDSVTIETINGLDVSDVLANVINVNTGFLVENPLEFESIEIDNLISPNFVNNVPMNVLLSQNTDQFVPELVVHGDILCKDGILIDGQLNSINFTAENVLLKDGDQSLSNLNADALLAEKLSTPFINNLNMSQMLSLDNQTMLVQNIANLTVKTALVSGLVNKVDIPTLSKFALKVFGDQTLTHQYTFDSLHVNNLHVKTLNGKKMPDDLVLINGDEYSLDRDIEFRTNFTADSVSIARYINNIRVINGKLDILLADVADVQYITGHKELQNLELLSPVKLQGRINNEKFSRTNPVVTVDEEIVLTGDYVIDGDTTVETLMQAVELQSSDPTFSVQRLHERGLKITESKIPVHLNFAQQLNVQEVFADKINNVGVNTFVVMGANEEQVVSGWKTFVGDVFITGPTKLENVNGIYLPDLEIGVLKIYGNQTLSGKYHFENVVARRISNVKTEIGGNLWENVITTYGNQHISGTTLIEGSLEVQELVANAVHCASLINNYDFNALINDTAFLDQNVTIAGHKHFVELNTEHLNVNSLDLNRLPHIIEQAKDTFEFDEDIDLPQDIVIDTIVFNGRFNDIPSDSFGYQWLADGSEQVIESDQTFNKITIFGHLFIESGLVNDVSIKHISENSIKIDEPFHFGSATFSNGLTSFAAVTLDGQFESLDLNDVVLSHTKVEQMLTDQIVFNGDITVFGEVFFAGLISGVNLTQFCEFAFSENPKSLHINGNAYFAKGPELHYINTIPVRYILENAWLTSREALITGDMEFDQVLFQEDLTVHGFVDDIKVELIAQTYLSKTRDQNVSALLHFEDGLLFGNGVYAKEGVVGGDVGGINLDEFISTALLNDYEQVFEGALYLEDCNVLELGGEYSVNELNLQTDVMRYDVNNIVTGKKIVKDVQTDKLLIDRNVKVQGVDLLFWLQASVLKAGTFRVPGKVTFFNSTTFANGISSPSLVNGMKFNKESVLLKSIPQTVMGLKVFHATGNQPLQFKSIKLKGLLNGVDMSDLMHKQAYKNQDLVFTAPVQFDANIVTPNINIQKLYQGVNTSELIRNISRFASIDNYYENYQRLLNMSYAVRYSLQAQAYYVEHYKVKQIYKAVETVIPVTLGDATVQYLAVVLKSGQNYSIQFDVWDDDGEYFHVVNDDAQIWLEAKLHYVKGITFRGKVHWYIEHEVYSPSNEFTSPSNKYEGSLFEVTETGLIKVVPSILHNGTQSVETVRLPDVNKECLLMLFEHNAGLYCENNDDLGAAFLSSYQQLAAYNSSKAAVSLIAGVPYIFLINRGGVQDQASVDIWRFDSTTKVFQIVQVIYVASPNSLTAAFYGGGYYLAVASGLVRNAKYAGLLDIRRFDLIAQQFVPWQDISLNAPVQIEFANLPTEEFVLYVVTDNPAEPLMVYAYEGISQFRQRIVASTIPKIFSIRSFTTVDNRHFVLAQNMDEIRVIEAVFKGKQYDF